jgi:NitT/TauT family transport system permease protein
MKVEWWLVILISFGQGSANTAMVFDAIGLLTVIGIVMYWSVSAAESRVLHFLPRATTPDSGAI